MSENAREIFKKNLNYIATTKGKTQTDIVEALGISASTVSDWFNGKKYPRVDKMQRLADFFGVRMSELTNESANGLDNADPLAEELFACYGEVKEHFDESDLEDIKLFMRMKAERKRKKELEGK